VTGYLREVLAAAQKLGFAFDGYSGGGHPRLVDTAGHYVTVAATPGDHRAVRNAIATMERISGQKLPRPNAGKHRCRWQAQLNTTPSPAERRTSAEVESLLTEADSLRREFDTLTAAPTRASIARARRILARHAQICARLQQLHRIIDPISTEIPQP